MEAKLVFKITKTNGEVVQQEIGCPASKLEEAVQHMLAQYSQVGMVKREGKRYTLLTASQIATVEVEIPTILTATTGEVENVAAAAQTTQNLIQMP